MAFAQIHGNAEQIVPPRGGHQMLMNFPLLVDRIHAHSATDGAPAGVVEVKTAHQQVILPVAHISYSLHAVETHIYFLWLTLCSEIG